jgi:DNA-binding transcriptional MocR family regulator
MPTSAARRGSYTTPAVGIGRRVRPIDRAVWLEARGFIDPDARRHTIRAMSLQSGGDWAPHIQRGRKALYQAIADALADDVRSGRLAPGVRLPPQRRLAAFLGVDLTTITRAYAEAARRGLITARVGQGSFVAPLAAGQAFAAATGAPVDLTMNMPPVFEQPGLARRMWRGFADLEARQGLPVLMRYQDPGGARDDRLAGAAWLQARIPGLAAERTLVAAGAQAAIGAVIGALANPGDPICCEALAYPGVRAAAAQLGLQVVGLEMDGEGILPAALEAACRAVGPKALCCTPTLQNPTTSTMSLARRREIVAIARRHRLPIVEDDAYGALPETPEPPLAALAPELTWHIASLSKVAAPALRIAYIAVPDERGGAQVAARLRAAAGMASPLTAAVATAWIRDGTAAEVLRAIRSEARARRRMAADALGAALMEPADAFHLWLPLPPPWTRGAFQAALRSRDISVVPSDAFVTTGEAPEAVRIGLGAPATRDDLARALSAMAQVLAMPPEWTSYV